MGRLSPGDEIEVTGKVAGKNWYRVAFEGDKEGFIFGKLIQDEASYKAAQAEVLQQAAAVQQQQVAAEAQRQAAVEAQREK